MKNATLKPMVRLISVPIILIFVISALCPSARAQNPSEEIKTENSITHVKSQSIQDQGSLPNTVTSPEKVIDKIDLEPLLRYLDERDQDRSNSLLNPSSNEQLILNLASVIILFGFPVLIVGIVGFNNYRQRKLVLSTVEKMVEKGFQIPLDLLQEKKGNRATDLKKGVIWLATGFGILAVILSTEKEQWSLSLIPIFVGIGYLIVWKLERRESSQSRLTLEESDIT